MDHKTDQRVKSFGQSKLERDRKTFSKIGGRSKGLYTEEQGLICTRVKIIPLFDHPSSLQDWIGFSFRVECGNMVVK